MILSRNEHRYVSSGINVVSHNHDTYSQRINGLTKTGFVCSMQIVMREYRKPEPIKFKMVNGAPVFSRRGDNAVKMHNKALLGEAKREKKQEKNTVVVDGVRYTLIKRK